MSEYDRLKAQKDKLLDSDKANKAGGLWYRRWYKSQARIEQLEREVERLCDWIENEVGVDLPFKVERTQRER